MDRDQTSTGAGGQARPALWGWLGWRTPWYLYLGNVMNHLPELCCISANLQCHRTTERRC